MKNIDIESIKALLCYDKAKRMTGFRDYYVASFPVIRGWLRNNIDDIDYQTAEDLTQDTFKKALERMQDAPLPTDNPEAYIWRIASNVRNDYFRTTSPRPQKKRKKRMKTVPLHDELPDDSEDISAMLDNKEILKDIQHLYTTLPPTQAFYWIANKVLRYTPEQLALFLSNSQDQIYNHTRNAKKRLRQELTLEQEGKNLSLHADQSTLLPDGSWWGLNWHIHNLEHLNPDDQTELRKQFGLKHINQLPEVAKVMGILQVYSATEAQLAISITPIVSKSKLFDHSYISQYIEFKPDFQPDSFRGEERTVIGFAEPLLSYSSNLKNKDFDEKKGIEVASWTYDFGNRKITVTKDLDAQHIHLILNPSARPHRPYQFLVTPSKN